MSNQLLAKSRPVETIEVHTQALKRNFDLLRRLYPGLKVDWDILELALLFHDLGKINSKFQNKLYKQLKLPVLEDMFPDDVEIPHGNLSAAFLDRKKLKEKFDDISLNILYQAIYYHHPRYLEDNQFDYYKRVLTTDLQPYVTALPADIPFLVPVLVFDFNKYIRDRIDIHTHGDHAQDVFCRYVMVKGLLNRLDYAASAHIDVEVPNCDLQEKTLAFLKEKGGLREIQHYLLAHQEENNVIVASTGIGKTEAGLLWIGNHKGFFTLPLRVSNNAIYKRIKYENIQFKETVLLHSDALAFMLKNDASLELFSEYTRARQLSMPLTITTVDQLFKIVFKSEGFESILASLAYSKVIIDEIQMYSPEIVACIIMGLKYITMMGGKFSILTATFPEVLDSFLKQSGLKYNYQEFLLDRQRHKINLLDADIREAITEINQKGLHSKVLVIVNTVTRAQEVFALLGDMEKKYLLHSRFIKKDRHLLEEKIKAFSDSNDTGIWVTTQVVEASLDIDFDYLFTELSTVDGLFQRMGRCYRKRDFLDETGEANVHVFLKNSSGVGTFIDREIFDLSKTALKKFHGNRISEKEKLAVVKDVYSLEKIKGTEYYQKIRERLNLLKVIPAYEMNRDQIDQKFRDIKSFTVIPIEIYQNHVQQIQDWINEIGSLGFARDEKARESEKKRKIELLEQIKDLTVDVPYYLIKHIKERMTIDRYNEFRIIDLEYSERTGLGKQGGSNNFL